MQKLSLLFLLFSINCFSSEMDYELKEDHTIHSNTSNNNFSEVLFTHSEYDKNINQKNIQLCYNVIRETVFALAERCSGFSMGEDENLKKIKEWKEKRVIATRKSIDFVVRLLFSYAVQISKAFHVDARDVIFEELFNQVTISKQTNNFFKSIDNIEDIGAIFFAACVNLGVFSRSFDNIWKSIDHINILLKNKNKTEQNRLLITQFIKYCNIAGLLYQRKRGYIIADKLIEQFCIREIFKTQLENKPFEAMDPSPDKVNKQYFSQEFLQGIQ